MHRIETKPREFIAETTGYLTRTSSLGFDSDQDLIEFMKGKKILDLGSGAGLFAKQCYAILGDQTIVVSMNPRLADRFYTDQHIKVDEELVSRKTWFDEIYNCDYEVGLKKYAETALAANWNNLPFAKESFDCIFATGSFMFYRSTYHDNVLKSLIQTVKKNTGEVRIETYNEGPEITKAIKLALKNGCYVKHEATVSGGYLLIKRGKK